MTLKNLKLALQLNNGNINEEINLIIDFINQFLTEQKILHYEINLKTDQIDQTIELTKIELQSNIDTVSTRLTQYLNSINSILTDHVNNNNIHITADERIKWNNIADYTDETVKGHAENLVIHVTQEDKDLWNATLDNAKDFARELFNRLTSFEIIKCTELPTEDIKEMTIYFLQIDPEQDDLYEEYMYLDKKWEKIGNTRIDLSDYVTKSMLQTEVDTLNQTIDNLRDNINQNIQDIADLNSGLSQIHTHDNKQVLDRFSENTKGDLLYNGDQIFIDFTEQDVRTLINYLWDIEEHNLLTIDNKYILTKDNYIFNAKEGGSL